jgi:hypothetical protein
VTLCIALHEVDAVRSGDDVSSGAPVQHHELGTAAGRHAPEGSALFLREIQRLAVERVEAHTSRRWSSPGLADRPRLGSSRSRAARCAWS